MTEFPSSEHISNQFNLDMQKYISEVCIQRFDIDVELQNMDNVVQLPIKEAPDDLVA